MSTARPSVHVDIWSDIACPWCWVGKRNLQEATRLVDFAVRATYRAFQLDPEAPSSIEGPIDYAGRLASKYRVSHEQARGMLAQMTERGRQAGVEFHFDTVMPTNTFDAHRLLAHALTTGHQTAAKERFLRAYFAEGRDLADAETLTELAEEVGMERAAQVLASGQYAEDVRTDLRTARSVGITGVPFFLMEGRLAVSGAHPPDVLAGALQKALGMSRGSDEIQGEVCSVDGC